MKKMICIVAVAGLVLALAPTAALADGTASEDPKAPTPPPGGYPPSYRLMFVTEAGHNASATNIAWYNNEVNTAANTAPSQVIGLSTWTCVGSTANIDARDNTGTNVTGGENDVPIYNFAGEMLAANNAGLWSGSLLGNPGTIDVWDGFSFETGVEQAPSLTSAPPDNMSIYASTWTGTQGNGTKTANPLGADDVDRGRSERTWSGDWIKWGGPIPNTAPRGGEWDKSMPRLIAISAPIPEPATMSLLALGGLAALIRRRRRA